VFLRKRPTEFDPPIAQRKTTRPALGLFGVLVDLRETAYDTLHQLILVLVPQVSFPRWISLVFKGRKYFLFTSILVNSATLLIIVDFKHETNGNNDIPNFIVVKNTSFQSYLLGKLRI
jgi:hypothetical protein